MDKFWERVQVLMHKHKITQANMCDILKMPLPTFKGILYRGKIPNGEVVYTIAKTLGVSMEYLITGFDSTLVSDHFYNEFMDTIDKLEKDLSSLKQSVHNAFSKPE